MGWYPEELKTQAAATWAVCRSDTTTASVVGVPVGRIKAWKEEPWWKNVVGRVVKDKNDELDAALTGVIEKASTLLADRLENGDVKINFKTGEVIRAPADIKSLLMSVGIIFDKRQLLRGEATSRTESISSSQKLEELKEAFTKFSKATEIEGIYEEPPVNSPESDTQLLLESDGDDGGLVSGEAGLQAGDDSSGEAPESGDLSRGVQES